MSLSKMRVELPVVLLAFLAALALVTFALPSTALAADAELTGAKLTTQAADAQAMYRLYNPYSGEHFYTADASERDDVIRAGWHYEGVGWTAPSKDGTSVYRLYNPYAGEHHYTMSADERDSLVASGWTDEGAGWSSDLSEAVPLYREYNPYMSSCNHNYTTNRQEHDDLVSLGWIDEGVAWHGLDQEVAVVPFSNPESITMPQNLSEKPLVTLSGTLRYDDSYRPVLPVHGFYYLDFDSPIAITHKSWTLSKWTTKDFTHIQVGMDLAWSPDATSGNREPALDPYIGKHVVITGYLKPDAGTAYYSTDVVMEGGNYVDIAEL